MKKFIVITSIAETEAIKEYASMKDWKLIVVGDRKGPLNAPINSTFIKYQGEIEKMYSFTKTCPIDHYCRKNIGYLHAMSLGAKTIYDTDDDNYPLGNWADLFREENNLKYISTNENVFNIYKLFTDTKIWPRGYPIQKLQAQIEPIYNNEGVDIAIWQGLADNDPDVDAIYRLIVGKEVKFRSGAYGIAKNTYVPFNSQNTAWKIDAFEFLYLPCTVSFRFTDILRGYVAQRLTWQNNMCIGFKGPTVHQLRNEHDLMKDFADEYSMYTQIERLINILDQIQIIGKNKKEWMLQVYEKLIKEGIAKSEELKHLTAWLDDIKEIES